MTEYYIRETETPQVYSIAKYAKDAKAHLDTYTIHMKPKPPVCTCPAYKPYCKHITMITEWLEHREEVRVKVYYDDKAKKFLKHGMDLEYLKNLGD